MNPMPPAILALFAHPDDAEFLCAGTLVHLAKLGAPIHLATMTAGDCGSSILPPEKISRVRRKEAERAAARLGAEYSCFGFKDLRVIYDVPALRKVIEFVRRIDPALVFTHSPSDYVSDHEATSRLTQSACFGAMIPNFGTGARRAARVTRVIPHLYYTQPFGGRNIFGDEIRPRLVVDISANLPEKKALLACHESQQAWLRAQHGIERLDNPVESMARQMGELSGFKAAEGFRQHLGQAFPQTNLLKSLLGDLVRDVTS